MTQNKRTAVHRLSARVLLFDDAGRLLLVEGGNPERPAAGRWWFPLGGGVEDGEDLLAAVTRELREEAGITRADIGPLVWLRWADFPYGADKHLYQREHYFIGHTSSTELAPAGWTAYERRQELVLRWWDLADLAARDEEIVPPELLDLIGPLSLGEYPASPIELRPLHVDD